MAQPSHRPDTSAAPRWRTLAVLAAAVSGLHLWGLGAVPTMAGAADAQATTAAAAIEVTRVGWVVPSPPVVTPPKPPDTAAPAPTARTVRPARPAAGTQASAGEASAPLPDAAQVVQVAQADKAPAPSARAAAPPPAVLPPSQPPASTRLAYDIEGVIKGLSYRASSTFDWKLEGGRYEARTDMSMFLVGSRVQTSVGSVGPGGLMPERFSDKRRSEVATHFERDAGRIRFSGNAPEAVLLPGAQDRLSLFMQLAGLLQARPHAAGEVIDFQVAGTGDAEPWRFEVGELQNLELPAGTVSARWVRRLPRKPHDSTVEMWLAPSLNHLPVRLRISQANGDVADQRLARLP